MRQFDKGFGFRLDEDLGEEAGSYQRLLAALVDARELAIEPEPVLRDSDWDAGGELLERQLTTV